MRFLPVVNLWDAAVHTAICNGQLKLQVGQWVRCSSDKQLSRFVSVHNGILNVAHGCSNKEVNARFNQRINVRRATVARFGKL